MASSLWLLLLCSSCHLWEMPAETLVSMLSAADAADAGAADSEVSAAADTAASIDSEALPEMQLEEDLLELNKELAHDDTMSSEQDVADMQAQLMKLSSFDAERSPNFCVGGSSGRTCPQRGTLFREGNMLDAVIQCLQDDFPGLDAVIRPCYEIPRAKYCTQPADGAVLKVAMAHFQKVMAGRLKAIKIFFKEYQTKGLNLLKVLTEAHNVIHFKERKPKTLQTDQRAQQSRYWQQYGIFVMGKLVTGLSSLVTTGLEEVGEALAVGPLALFIPISAYVASLLFVTTSSDNKIGQEMQHLTVKIRRGLQTEMMHVHNFIDKKIKQVQDYQGTYINFLKLVVSAENALTTWFGRAMGDKDCFQTDVDCDFQSKSHNKMAAASKIEDPWSEVKRLWSGHAGAHTGGDKKDFSTIIDIITRSDDLIANVQKGDGKRFVRGVGTLANTWNGLVSGSAGSVALRSIYNDLTNIRTEDLNREHMRIIHTFQFKDLKAEWDLQHIIKASFKAVLKPGPPGDDASSSAPADDGGGGDDSGGGTSADAAASDMESLGGDMEKVSSKGLDQLESFLFNQTFGEKFPGW